MADFSALKTAIQNYIKQNGNEEITGEILQTILLSIVNTLGDSAIDDLITALNNEVANRQNADGSLEGAINQEGVLRSNADSTLQGNINAEAIARENADAALQAAIDLINSYIPAQTSSSNQLADKAFVNSSIATATATFRGSYNVVSDLSLSYNATHTQIQTALATKMSELSITPDNNDYAFVQIPTADATPTQIAKVEKYKYNGTAWAFEYELNNSGFTAAQWAAINSGATLELIGKLSALPTNAELTELLSAKQNVIQDLATIRSGASAGATAVQPATLNAALSNTVIESGVFDLTAYNNGTTYADLNAALTALNALPAAFKKGGMSMKFVHTSDNKYVQYRLMSTTWSNVVADWQGMDDEPTVNSENLVKSGGVYNAVNNLEEILLTPIVPKRPLALKTDGTLETRNCRIAMISLTEIEGHIIKFDKPSGAPHFSGFYDYAFLDYNLGIISGAAYGGNSHFEIEIPQGASAFIYLVPNADASYENVTVIGKRIPSTNYNLVAKYEAFNVYDFNGLVPCYFNISNNTISNVYARTGMLKISVPSGAKFVSFPVLPSFVATSLNYQTNVSPCAVFLDKNCNVIQYYGRLLGFGGRMEVEIPQGTDCICIAYLTDDSCQALSSVGIDIPTFSQEGGVQFLTDESILDKDVKDACDMLAITKDESNIFPSEYSEEFIYKYLNTNVANLINTQEHFDYPSLISGISYNTAIQLNSTFFTDNELYENDVECIIYELYANSAGTVDITIKTEAGSKTQRLTVTQGYNKVICYRRMYNNTNERVIGINLGSTSRYDEIGRVYIGRCNGDFSVITPEDKNKSFVSTNSDLFEKIQSSYRWLTNLTPQEDVLAINGLTSYTGFSGHSILDLKPIRFDCTRYGLIVKTRGIKTGWVIINVGADDNISLLINGLVTGENEPQYVQYTNYKRIDSDIVESTCIFLFDNDAEYLHNLKIQQNSGVGNFDIVELSVVPLPSYITKPLQLDDMLSIERGDRLAINSLHSTYSDSTGAFNKKKFVMVGDSIAAQSTYSTEIIKHTGMSYYKKIAAGGAMVRPSGAGNCIYWFVDDIPEDSDFILFVAGQNDTGVNMGVPEKLGTIDDAPYISYDSNDDVDGVATFYAAFKGMLVKTIQRCPKAKIVVCGLLPTWVLTPEGMERMTANKTKKSDIIKSICELYGIQFVDLIRKSGINWYNACWMFNHDGSGTDIWPDGTAGGPTSDLDGQVHPSSEGGKKCAEVILSEII